MGIARTNAATKSNLLITDLSSFGLPTERGTRISQAGLYQHVVESLINATGDRAATLALGRRLAVAAQHAADMQQNEHVDHIAKVLLSTPFSEKFEGIGLYYQALAQSRLGHIDEARAIASRAFEVSPDNLKAKALVLLGWASWSQGDAADCQKLTLESARLASRGRTANLRVLAGAQKNLASLRGFDGDNRGALQLLSNSLPLARHVGRWYPAILLDHLNALAVELMECGRLLEARSITSVMLASPLMLSYRDWRETAADIEARMQKSSRTIVSVAGPVESGQRDGLVEFPISNAVPLPETRAASHSPGSTALESTPAEVIELHRWRRREEPGSPRGRRLTASERVSMDNGEKLMRVVDLLSQDSVDAHQLDQAVTAVEDIVLGKEPNYY
jgi:hypothetical protein